MQLLDSTFWNRIKPLLDQALTLAPEERQPFLDQACSTDPTLRVAAEHFFAELERLDQRGFMESPMGDRFETLIAKALEPGAGAVESLKIGSYRTVRTLGYGGMGTVFLAERVDGEFERQVALKLIRQGAHSRAAALRFLHERQILARLKHPNIAYLHDGGVTDDGRPYFVMEYIEGQPLIDYGDAHQLAVRERLGLFLQLCAALQYAHRNLVVHRDVKPSNILVTEAGQVKLLDFGIAKVLSGENETAMTQPGMPLLTPDYAAPEQVKGEAITMVTDVYALGIVLYELLSGHRPYQVQGTSVEEWVRVICETEPPPPSLMVAQQHADAGIERVSASGLQRQLAGDLDTIVLKTLKKEPERRYGSVEALAGDVERYLSGNPILARQDTVGYRLSKFVRRHRVGVGFAALLVLLVSGFTWRTVIEQRRAEAAAVQAEISATQANEVSGFLVDLFTMSDPYSAAEVRGDTLQVRVFLERGAAQLDALSGQEEVQSMLRRVLGRVYERLGQYEQAEVFFREALAQRRLLYGEQSVEVAESMGDLGLLLTYWVVEEGFEEAEQMLRSALAIRKQLLEPGHVDIATSLYYLAEFLRVQGDYAEAEPLFREALAIQRTLVGEEHLQVASMLHDLARVLRAQGKNAEAEPMYREALAIRKKLLGEEHPDVASVLNSLALVRYTQGDYAETESMFREVVAMYRKLLGKEHSQVATGLNNLASILGIQGKYAESEKMHREVVVMKRKLMGEEHPSIAISLSNLGFALMNQGKNAEAEAMYRESLALSIKFYGEEHPDVATTLNNLATVLDAQGKYTEAERTYREGLAIKIKLLGEEHAEVAAMVNNLAEALHRQGKYAEAESLFSEALAMRRKLLGEEHPELAYTLRDFAALRIDQEAYAEADTMLQRSFDIFEQTFGLDHPNTQKVIKALLDLYTAWGKPEQAEHYRAMRTEGAP